MALQYFNQKAQHFLFNTLLNLTLSKIDNSDKRRPESLIEEPTNALHTRIVSNDDEGSGEDGTNEIDK